DRVRTGFAQVRRLHHGGKRGLDWPLRIREESGDAGERLVFFGIEDMEDGADQESVAGLLPVIAFLEGAFGVDQDVGDVLDVADLPLAAPNLKQRIVG